MKKILPLVILFILVFSISAFADMGLPEISVRAVVTNPQGADLYDYKWNVIGHLDYGYEITTMYEYSTTDPYGQKVLVCDTQEGKIIASNLAAKNSEASLSSESVSKINKEYWDDTAYAVKDTYFYSGPSILYSKTHILPVGSKIEVTHYLLGGGWLYGTCEGVSGWFPEPGYYDDSIAYKSTDTITLKKDIAIKGTDVVVKEGTVLHPKYEYTFGKSRSYYIDEQGLKGYLEETYFTEADEWPDYNEENYIVVSQDPNEEENIAEAISEIVEKEITPQEIEGDVSTLDLIKTPKDVVVIVSIGIAAILAIVCICLIAKINKLKKEE